MYNGPVCLGLTRTSTNEEIKKAAFDFILERGYMSVATVSAVGKLPMNRGLEVHRLDDDGYLYIGASHGKHFCDEVRVNPYICAVLVDTVAVRVSARLEEVPQEDRKLYARYWRQNKGTEKMYRRDLANFRLFRLIHGSGEVFHVYEDDAIARVRFTFSGGVLTPWSYTVGDACIGCGDCVTQCMMRVISVKNGKAAIDHYGCNECGICRESCAVGGIDNNGFYGNDYHEEEESEGEEDE